MPLRRFRFAMFVLAALAVGLITLSCRTSRSGEASPFAGKSVLVVMVDTLRADFLGAYGFDGEISPNLDRFAAESIVFERCVAPAPWTTPSIASLFLSRYPQAHKVVLFQKMFIDRKSGAYQSSILPTGQTTMAEVFERGGYTTAAFVANPWISERQGFARGFQWFQGGSDRFIVGEIAEWFGKTTDPFFAYLHSMTVHGPYEPLEEDVEALRSSPGLGETRPLSDEQTKAINPYLREPAWAREATAGDLREWRLRYGAQVRELDRQFGEVIEALRRTGRLDSTIVVVTADHGEELGEHGGWDHGNNLYDHQLHVPLMIRFPGLEAGARVEEVVSLVDLRPTLTDAVGIAEDSMLDGRSLMALAMRSREATKGRVVFAGGVKHNTKMRAVVEGRYKAIVDGRAGTTELFDTLNDPGELENLAGREPERVASRLESLRLYEEVAEILASDAETTEIPPETLEKLKSLGYVD